MSAYICQGDNYRASKEKDFVLADETAIKFNIAVGDSRFFKEKIHNNHGHFERKREMTGCATTMQSPLAK